MNPIDKKPLLPVLTFPLPDLNMVLVEAHSADDFFMMGDDDNSSPKDEKPAHRVSITQPYYIGQYQVTQALYREVTKTNPSRRKGKNRPVETVSWDAAKVFIDKLNDSDAVKAYKATHTLEGEFRLPTEAEWEFAARGGIHSQGYQYCGSDDLKQVGWYRDNSGGETKPVGLLLPNELGLYDMSGNVFEWCEDDWHSNYNSLNRPDDGSPWIDSPRNTRRVVRGGYYFLNPFLCRPTHRYDRSGRGVNFFGFRVVFFPSV
ncbi:MAG: formylglycine-generating enzyme family protein [Bacteroidetes bacterium]|nr:formylglycine-generating enzyme family protein [Bacteroidota bacterium]